MWACPRALWWGGCCRGSQIGFCHNSQGRELCFIFLPPLEWVFVLWNLFLPKVRKQLIPDSIIPSVLAWVFIFQLLIIICAKQSARVWSLIFTFRMSSVDRNLSFRNLGSRAAAKMHTFFPSSLYVVSIFHLKNNGFDLHTYDQRNSRCLERKITVESIALHDRMPMGKHWKMQTGKA